MQIKYFNLSILTIVILILQLIINNITILYIDCLTLLLVGFLLEGLFLVRLIFIIGLSADLFGHWYLGTHLLAITLISFLVKGLVNFYRVSNILQKVVLNGLFSLLVYIIIGLIDMLFHKSSINWLDILIEIVILNPIILFLSNIFIIKLPSDIIRTE